MAAAPHYTKEQREHKMADFLKMYEQSHGLLYRTCKEVGVDDMTIGKWRKRYPEFDEAVKKIDDAVIDFVTGQLYKKIEEGDKASIMFFLKCRAHWKETQKVEVTNGNEFDVESALQELAKTVKKK